MKRNILSIMLVGFLAFSCTKEKDKVDPLKIVLVKDSLEMYKKLYDEAAYFSIDKNDNAQKQFAPQEVESVMTKVVQDFSQLNQQENGNPLLPVDSTGKPTKVNKMSVINHKWLIIDFFGEGVVGELIIKYDYSPDKTTEFTVLDTVLY
ncbi:MAG: hydrolase [Flavobacterium sp.]